MCVKFRYKGERLWFRVSSVNDETVVGRVWNHPVNPGLLRGQMLQTLMRDILFVWYMVLVARL